MSTLRRFLAVSTGIVTLSIGAVSPAHAAGGFAGSWTATDVGDGSSMTLDVKGNGPRFAVQMIDYYATVCGGARATISGSGQQDQNVLIARVTLTCNPGGNPFRERIDLTWHYESGTDTLSDPDGNVWERA